MGNHMKDAIEKMQRKEEAGLNCLYAKTFNYVYLRAKNVLKKEADIQKLMKEVYMQAFSSAENLKEEEMYEWLGKLTYSLGAKYFRKKKAREATLFEFEKNDLLVGKGAVNEATVEAVGKAMDQLPDLYQATFYAFYYDYMNVVDIAEMMDCTIGVILYRLNYTSKFLKESFEIYNEDGSKERKAVFSVENICQALRKWSVEHCMGMATAQTLYTTICNELGLKAGSIEFEGMEFAGVNNRIVYRKSEDLNPLIEEIELYSPKETEGKKRFALIGVIAAVVILLAVAAVLVLGNKDKEDKKPSADAVVQEDDPVVEDEPIVEDEPVVEDESIVEDEPVVEDEPIVEDEPVVEEEPSVDEPVAETPEETSEYIIATSNTEALTIELLSSYTKDELRLARNEIYARHGMIFGVESLDSYFATKSWYEAKYEINDFYDKVEMSTIEEENIELILSVEKNME